MHSILHFLGLDSASGTAYLAWSGIIGDAGLFAAAAAFAFHAAASYRHKNCHVRRCLRVGHLAIEGTPWVVCRRHHPIGAPTHAEVIAAHDAAKDLEALE